MPFDIAGAMQTLLSLLWHKDQKAACAPQLILAICVEARTYSQIRPHRPLEETDKGTHCVRTASKGLQGRIRHDDG